MEENKDDLTAGQETGDKKTFTQDEVSRIVRDRLAKEKTKNEKEYNEKFNQREQELEQRALQLSAREILQEKGLPADILSALNCSNAETVKSSIETIEKLFKNETAPQSNLKGLSPTYTPTHGEAVSPSEDIRRAMGLTK